MRKIRACLFVAGILWLSVTTAAIEISLQVVDDQGDPVADAAIAVYSDGAASMVSDKSALVDQVDRQFMPYVLAVEVGTKVHFPNSDDIRHHVYSFSPTKRFELRLYHGTTAEPVLFDQAGKVVLGCNIHDDMISYIYVVDTPIFAVSDTSGKVQFMQLPEGDLRYEIQHPQLAEPARGSLSRAEKFAEINIGKLLPDPRQARPRTELEALFDR